MKLGEARVRQLGHEGQKNCNCNNQPTLKAEASAHTKLPLSVATEEASSRRPSRSIVHAVTPDRGGRLGVWVCLYSSRPPAKKKPLQHSTNSLCTKKNSLTQNHHEYHDYRQRRDLVAAALTTAVLERMEVEEAAAREEDLRERRRVIENV